MQRFLQFRLLVFLSLQCLHVCCVCGVSVFAVFAEFAVSVGSVLLASFPGSAQLSVACSTVQFIVCAREERLGTRLLFCTALCAIGTLVMHYVIQRDQSDSVT